MNDHLPKTQLLLAYTGIIVDHGRRVNTVARLTKPIANRGISVEVSKAVKDHWGRLIPVGAGKVPSLRISFTYYEHTIH